MEDHVGDCTKRLKQCYMCNEGFAVDCYQVSYCKFSSIYLTCICALETPKAMPEEVGPVPYLL